jgi:predicted dehydrogenase
MLGDIVDARAECRTTISERPDADGQPRGCDAEDGFTAWLRFASGADAVIDTTFAATASIAPRFTVSGSDGVLECVADARVTIRRADGTREDHDRPAAEGDPHLEPMRRWALVVRDAVDAGVVPPGAATFEDGLECARVLDRLRGVPAEQSV